MSDRKNITIKTSTGKIILSGQPRSLVARGLSAVLHMDVRDFLLADENDAEKLFRQGMRYRYGECGTQVDAIKARSYFTKSAELNHAEAQFELHSLIYELEPDDDEGEEAYEWLERSAYLGYGPAIHSIVGTGASDTSLQSSDEMLIKAQEWYEPEALAGNAERQFEFSEILFGLNGNHKEGYIWLTASATQDYAPACSHLGTYLLRSNILDETTTTKGVNWLERAADWGSISACRKLGDLFLQGVACGKFAINPARNFELNLNIAIAWYERAIGMGDRATAYKLGKLHLDGEQANHDYSIAEKWLLHAAMEGYDSAKITLGVEYASGLRLRQDADAAIHWLEQAENSRITGLRLAEIYLEGKIVPQNFVEAIKWLTHSADGGSWRKNAMKIVVKNCFDGRFNNAEESAAQAWLLQMATDAHELVADMEHVHYDSHALHLAELYELGLGVAQDREKAIYWYKQSGLYLARTRLRELGINWETA